MHQRLQCISPIRFHCGRVACVKPAESGVKTPFMYTNGIIKQEAEMKAEETHGILKTGWFTHLRQFPVRSVGQFPWSIASVPWGWDPYFDRLRLISWQIWSPWWFRSDGSACDKKTWKEEEEMSHSRFSRNGANACALHSKMTWSRERLLLCHAQQPPPWFHTLQALSPQWGR